MSLRSIARTYARAFADTVPDPAALRKIEGELHAFGLSVRTTAELRDFLVAPQIPAELKQEAVEKILSGAGATPETRRFARFLIERHRAVLAPEIAEEFSGLVRERLAIVDAEVVSARPLGPGLEEKARAALARVTGREVRAAFRVDPAVLGGVRARVGTTIYDGSLRGRLDRLRESLLGE